MSPADTADTEGKPRERTGAPDGAQPARQQPPESSATRARGRRRALPGKRFSAALSLAASFLTAAAAWSIITTCGLSSVPSEAMLAAEAAEPAKLPITVHIWIVSDRADEANRPGTSANTLLAALEAAQASPFKVPGLKVVLNAVTPGGCTSADPLRLLLGSDLPGAIRRPRPLSGGCPAQLKLHKRDAGDPARVEAALEATVQHLGHPQGPGTYNLFLLDAGSFPNLKAVSEGPAGAEQTRLTLGQRRTAWLVGPVWDDKAGPGGRLRQELNADAAAAAAAAVAALSHGGGPLVVGPPPRLKQAKLRAGGHRPPQGTAAPLVAGGSLKVLVSLCNAHPPSGACRWDPEWLDTAIFRPLAETLKPLGAVSMESQTLQYTRPRVEGTWNEEAQAFELLPEQLPSFVDPEWNLDPDRAVLAGGSSNDGAPASSPAALKDLLHFVIFVPPPEQRPMQIRSGASAGSGSPAFTLTSWGGVFLLNPTQGCCADESEEAVTEAEGGAKAAAGSGPSPQKCTHSRTLTEREHLDAAASAVAQVRGALGLQPGAAGSPRLVHLNPPGDLGHEQHAGGMGSTPLVVDFVPALHRGVAEWEVDMLVRRQIEVQTKSAAETLGSLARLLETLPNLPIYEEVSELVESALERLRPQAEAANASSNDELYRALAARARQAKEAADRAFFHPSIMAEHSYPVQHLIAMYMPYFLPITIPLLKGVYLEAKHFLRS